MVTSKAIEKKLADLRAASVEAGVELKRLDEQIEQAKLQIGMDVLAGKAADKSKLKELTEKRDELGMRLSALAKKIKDTQVELVEAQDAEYKAKRAEYEAESEKQLVEIVKAIYELNTQSAKWMQLARESDRTLRNAYGRGGIDTHNLPVAEILNTTDHWLHNYGSRKFAALLERAGVPNYYERLRQAKENAEKV